MSSMKPSEIVRELDKHIVGQQKAKHAVAVALRSRWRRQQIPEPLRQEVTPKNILMIGPTGVGKTEIARRLARMSGAPFIKVEATKFTEVGYVGRDVETIIRDLVEVAIKQEREHTIVKNSIRATEAAEKKILSILLASGRSYDLDNFDDNIEQDDLLEKQWLDKLRNNELDNEEIELELSGNNQAMEIFAPPGMEELTGQIQSMFQSVVSQQKKRRKMKVGEARKLLVEEEASRLVNEEEVKKDALYNVEHNGIVFIDEIDKITIRNTTQNADVSRQGVQRDLLPLVEGTIVTTKYGMIKTDHILFIASGAFHLSKPSDMIPELQGRFPVQVELEKLTVDDFVQILSKTNHCLTKQYEALLKTEDIDLQFTDDGVRKISEMACDMNESVENIGARRLYTVMEKMLEEISFLGSESPQKSQIINAQYVLEHLSDLKEGEDFQQYVL
ncbi:MULTISPECIES: ATP-dependent protease ATPase subunit HslU [Candidatus Ichthyocystis]|uniref:ATP-dependent protease subunit HslU n=1 Tax=Candidatus Ichthyocystis hellenicum TaxID=1561003 RepID=A0A0S4M577_9BURK|nr:MULTISPECIES: ATP-dependent protease ATPase subunit HslU [Ichthyocystis]CUT17437.1 ATP-dependent protease subunit HslU [Candidatus Ichthyocystis hellenicum]